MNEIEDLVVVSVITAAYNAERFILEAYRSLLQQTFSRWEWCICDDCSNDNTSALLDRISSVDSRIRILRNDINLGAAASRNRCLDISRGKYLAFLDADDLWLPDKLSAQLSFMRDGTEISFTQYAVVDELNINILRYVDRFSLDAVLYKDLLAKRVTFGCSTVIVLRSCVGSKRMPLIRTGQDYGFWLSILRDGVVARRLNLPLTRYRLVDGSLSRNKFKKALRQWEIYRRHEGLSFWSASRYFISYIQNALFRK